MRRNPTQALSPSQLLQNKSLGANLFVIRPERKSADPYRKAVQTGCLEKLLSCHVAITAKL
jgi:hypothetical protein